jgi:hypothetical protein
MKRIALISWLGVLTAVNALSQGSITFANNLPGLRAPIYGPELDWINHGGDYANAKTGNTATGIPSGTQIYQGNPLENFTVRFWAAPGLVTDGRLLELGMSSTTTGTGITAGFFPSSLVLFPNLPPSGIATVQVRLYDPVGPLAFGMDSTGFIAAASALFQVNIGGTATGLRSFSAGWLDGTTLAPYVPEPSVGCLAVFGLLAMNRRFC